ncbi:MAG TPA: CotS family spore coat protein [Clostridia bacterium]|nr:CotS family spore coat protein [Clostridia bacterium]
MQGMEREIAENYGLDVKNLFPYKDTYMIVTAQGRKVIKKIPFSADRLKFVHGAKEHLANKGFKNTDRYICTLTGEPGFFFNNGCYTLTDFSEGRESNFDSDSDVELAALALADLHKASRGYSAPEDCKVQDDLGKLPGFFSKRLDDIKKMKKQAKKGKSRFDQLFLQYVDYFFDLGEKASQELEASDYSELTERTRAEKLFCHHDYTHHNILMEGDRVIVTNFDYCCHELRVYDIANFIRRKMRKCDWDISKTELIIKAYSSVDALNSEELAVMKIILQFPQKFWRVVNRYYNSRRSWSEKSFIMRLQEVIDEVAPLNTFLSEYQKLYL